MTYDLSVIHSEYPFEGKFLQVGGHRLHVLDEGKGETLVMVHGNPTWSFYYRRLVRDLSAQHRVIVPDHIGMGLSDKPSDAHYRYTLEQRVQDLEQTLEQLGAQQRLTLVAHDWGGMIALAYTLRNPTRVSRLVLMNTAGFFLPEGKPLPWQLFLVRRMPMGFLVRGLNAFVRGANWMCSTVPGKLTEVARRGYALPYDSWEHRIAVHRFVQDIPLSEADPAHNLVQAVSTQLPALVARPTLVFWGRRDFVFDDGFLAEWKRRVPTLPIVEYPQAGHYVLEDAYDDILPRIRQFLADNPLA
ncbi:MAG: alpha/beta fold hydrolase [Myxococcota bacterium]